MVTMDVTHHEVKRRALSGLVWNYAGSAVRAATSIALSIVLARILGPVPFGQVAVCLVVIGIGTLVCDMGLGPALVQAKSIRDEDVRFVFTAQCLLGLAMTLLVWGLSPLIALAFNQPETASVLRVLSVMFLIVCAGQTSVQLLQRRMDFRTMELVQVVAHLVGNGAVGLPMALRGWGVWSLVVGYLVSASLQGAVSYLLVCHPVRPRLRPASKGLVRFGVTVLVTNLVNATITNIDAVVVSHFFGAFATGLYRRVQTLLGQPRDMLVQALQRVLFTAGSRLQDDPQAIRQSLQMATGGLVLLLFPACFAVAAVPDAFIEGVLGPRWTAAEPLVMPLAIAVCVHGLLAVIGPFLWATNRIGVELRLQIVVAAAYLIVVPVAARHSLAAFTWCVTGVYLVRWGWLVAAAVRAQWITAREYLAVLARPAAVAVLTAMAARGLAGLAGPEVPALVLLAGVVGLCLASYAVLFAWHARLTPVVLHGTIAGVKRRLGGPLWGAPVEPGV